MSLHTLKNENKTKNTILYQLYFFVRDRSDRSECMINDPALITRGGGGGGGGSGASSVTLSLYQV